MGPKRPFPLPGFIGCERARSCRFTLTSIPPRRCGICSRKPAEPRSSSLTELRLDRRQKSPKETSLFIPWGDGTSPRSGRSKGHCNPSMRATGDVRKSLDGPRRPSTRGGQVSAKRASTRTAGVAAAAAALVLGLFAASAVGWYDEERRRRRRLRPLRRTRLRRRRHLPRRHPPATTPPVAETAAESTACVVRGTCRSASRKPRPRRLGLPLPEEGVKGESGTRDEGPAAAQAHGARPGDRRGQHLSRARAADSLPRRDSTS